MLTLKLEKTRNNRLKGDKVKAEKKYTKEEIKGLRQNLFSPTTYWSRESAHTFENADEKYILEVSDHFLIRSFERNVMTDAAFVLLQNLCEQGEILEVPVGGFFYIVSKKENVIFCLKFEKMTTGGDIIISALTTYKEINDFSFYPNCVVFEAETSNSREITFEVSISSNLQGKNQAS
jgi:hypothetical protein